MTFGLVLGAGGQAGEAFHRGVLRAMIDLGIDPRRADAVVGTSAGSVVASSLRRHTPLTGEHASDARPPRPRTNRSSALGLLRRPRQALNALLLTPEFTNGRLSVEFLREGLRGKHARWPDAPLLIVAVRRRDGKRVVFGAPGEPRPDVGAAVAASCAIPAYFAPVTIDGEAYVDGGLHSPTNADVLAGRDLDLVVVSSPMSVQPRSVGRRLDLPLRLLFHGYLVEETWVLRRRRTRVVTIEPDRAVLAVMGINMMDGRRIHDIEERAYELARTRLRGVPLAQAVRRSA